MEPEIFEFKGQRVFSVQSSAHVFCSLAVTQVLKKLKHRDQRQAPGSVRGLTSCWVECSELIVVVDGSEAITQGSSWVSGS